eukprot:s99_g32.t1
MSFADGVPRLKQCWSTKRKALNAADYNHETSAPHVFLRRPHTWQLLSVLCRSQKAAQKALQSSELRELLLNFQSEASTDARYAKHTLVKTLVDCHSHWISGLLDSEVMDMMTQFAQQGPYWVPRSAGAAMKDEAA